MIFQTRSRIRSLLRTE
ncbi:hypothetical protein [Blautia sp.]